GHAAPDSRTGSPFVTLVAWFLAWIGASASPTCSAGPAARMPVGKRLCTPSGGHDARRPRNRDAVYATVCVTLRRALRRGARGGADRSALAGAGVEGHRLDRDPPRHQRGGWRGLERGGGLDDIDAEQAAVRDAADELDRFAAGEATGGGGAGAAGMGGVKAVDVAGEVDPIGGRAADLTGAIDGPRGAVLPDLVEPDHGDAVLAAVVELGARVHPSRYADQHDLGGIEAGVDSARDRTAVVELLAGDIDRGVEMGVEQD